MMSYMPMYADTATIGVFPASPDDHGFAHRIFRDLHDRKYNVFFEPAGQTTLSVIVNWSDAFGWVIQYNNRVESHTIRCPEHLYKVLYSDFLLANQEFVPPSLKRPF